LQAVDDDKSGLKQLTDRIELNSPPRTILTVAITTEQKPKKSRTAIFKEWFARSHTIERWC